MCSKMTMTRTLDLLRGHSLAGSRIPAWLLCLCCVVMFWSASASARQITIISAVINLTYTDPESHTRQLHDGIIGRYGIASSLEPEYGQVVHVQTKDNKNHGCSPYTNVPSQAKWIALVQRGHCKFNEKVTTAGLFHNASAVVVYNNMDEDDLITMEHDVGEIVSVFIHKAAGEEIARLADSGVKVMMNISIGQVTMYNVVTNKKVKSSPLLVVSLTFVVLLILGLSALLVYTVRRSKYMQNKHRAQMVFTLQETAQAQENLLTAEARDNVPDNT